MYNSVFSMLIAAKAAEIKSNPTRTEILSEEQWLRKLIDGKKPMEWPCYNSWRPTFFRRKEDSDKLWAEDNQFQRPQFTPFQPLFFNFNVNSIRPLLAFTRSSFTTSIVALVRVS